MVHLTDEEMETYKNQRFCHICKQRFYDVKIAMVTVVKNLISKSFMQIFAYLLLVSSPFSIHSWSEYNLLYHWSDGISPF